MSKVPKILNIKFGMEHKPNTIKRKIKVIPPQSFKGIDLFAIPAEFIITSLSSMFYLAKMVI
jgi:hypothetical protein